jgi:hypothetical protein
MCLFAEISMPEKIEQDGRFLGFRFIILDGGLGFRCGYIEVPPGHPWFGKNYDEIKADCHGGLTFSKSGTDCGLNRPEGWWFGFDCGHCGDGPDPALKLDPPELQPFASLIFQGEVRTKHFVEQECCKLIHQAYRARILPSSKKRLSRQPD